MVQISEAASTLLLDQLVNTSVPPETGYRLAASAGGYKLRLDRPSVEDRVVHREGHVLFMVERKLDEELDQVVLDIKEGDQESLVLGPAPAQ